MHITAEGEIAIVPVDRPELARGGARRVGAEPQAGFPGETRSATRGRLVIAIQNPEGLQVPVGLGLAICFAVADAHEPGWINELAEKARMRWYSGSCYIRYYQQTHGDDARHVGAS